MADGIEHKHTFHYNGNYDLQPTYGLSESYGSNFLGMGYRFPVSQFAVTTDPRNANQLKAVSDKISTGTGTVEVSGVTPQVFESLPEQHLTELNRLKKLTGVDLTFHGPLVEPTGISKQGWNESHREQSERQMWSSIERAHKLDPKGNIVITFHSSNGLPDPETRVITEEKDPFTGQIKKQEKIKEFWIVDERTGDFRNAIPEKDFLRDKEKIYERFKDDEKEGWFRNLQHVNFNANAAAHHTQGSALHYRGLDTKKEEFMGLYKMYIENPQEAEKFIKAQTPEQQEVSKEVLNDIMVGDIYLRDAYQGLQNLYNQAYEAAQGKFDNGNEKERRQAKEDLAKLDAYKKELVPNMTNLEKPENVGKLNDEIVKGVRVLRTISVPSSLKPLKEFAIDKASDTFSNLALQSYDKFGSTAPIISIENPPAGSGLSRAEDLRDLIKESRKKFVKRATQEGRLSESEAEDQAKKLIGATWDVGHINMIRKLGYDKKDVVKETEKIAPYVKHVHLSDNFGLEHTELPMGMGNVPTKPMLDLISQYNKQAKKVIETGGNWFQFFQKTPLRETLEAFGSPVYPMAMAPYWNQAPAFGSSQPYFAGYGLNPDVHHSVYGSGFANLPIELGGQMAGKSRMSGNPIE